MLKLVPNLSCLRHFWLILLLLLQAACGLGGADQPRSASEQVIDAYAQYEAGNYARAAAELEVFLASHPDHAESEQARYTLARAYYWLEKYPASIEQMNVVIDAAGGRDDRIRMPKYLYWRGKAYVKNHQYPDAEQDFETVLARYPQSQYADNTDLARARMPYDQARDLTGQEPDYATQLASLLADAVVRLQGVNGFILRRPDSSLLDEAWYILGRVYHRQAYQNQANQNPASATLAAQTYEFVTTEFPLSNWRDNAFYQLGMLDYDAAEAALLVNDMTAAISAFEQAVNKWESLIARTDLSNPSALDDAQYFTGRAWYRTHELYRQQVLDGQSQFQAQSETSRAQADAALVSLSNLYPSSGWRDNALYYLARLDYDNADYAVALNDFDQLIAQYCQSAPTSICDQALYFRGRSRHQLARQGQVTNWALAASDYQRVNTRFASSIWADNAAYQYGRLAYDQADYSTAINRFTAVLAGSFSNQSAFDEAQYYLAKAYVSTAQSALAIEGFNLFIAGYQSSLLLDNAHIELARLYFAAGDCVAVSNLAGILLAQPWQYASTAGPVSDIIRTNIQTLDNDCVQAP